jgi:peptidoglycan hydrolase CwlO-like protein
MYRIDINYKGEIDMQLEKTKVSKLKSKKFWLKTAGVLIILSIFYNFGASSAKVDLGKQKANYDQLVKGIKDKKGETASVNKKLENIDKQYSDKKLEFDEAMKVVNNKKSVEYEIAKLEESVKGKQGEIAKFNADIKAKQIELASITGQVKEKKDAPKVLSAGQYIVGKDVPESRYKAVPNGSGSNFVVRSSGGDLKVNAILGDHGGLGVKEYVFFTENGDTIQTEASVKLIPVQ